MININIINSTKRKYLPLAKIKKTVYKIFIEEKIKKADLNIILVDDDFIHDLNIRYLEHDYPTDVISFLLEEQDFEGEVYVSVDTAEAQAAEYGVSLTNELLRLSVHGTLHLLGYSDISVEEKQKMTELENKFISYL